MKIFFLSLIISFQIFAQGRAFFLFQKGLTYKGTERITEAIDRNMEVGSVQYTSNFSAGIDGWQAIWGTLTGNVDAIYGQNDVLKVVGNASGAYVYKGVTGVSVGSVYAFTTFTFVPTSSSTTNVYIMSGPVNTIGGHSTKGSWTLAKGVGQLTVNNQFRIFYEGAVSGDSVYAQNVYVSKVPTYVRHSTHRTDTTSSIQYDGNYSLALIGAGAGNSTTVNITLPSAKFTAVESGKNYRFSIYAYTTTSGTTLTFNLGDITIALPVSTSGFNKLNFDFITTGSTTGDIKFYMNKAATIYIDDISFKSER